MVSSEDPEGAARSSTVASTVDVSDYRHIGALFGAYLGAIVAAGVTVGWQLESLAYAVVVGSLLLVLYSVGVVFRRRLAQQRP